MQEEDIKRIAGVVASALLKEIYGQATPSPSGGVSGGMPLHGNSAEDDTPPLVDLGDAAARKKSAIPAPHNPETLEEFLSVTQARVAAGKCGPRPFTNSYLCFLADHARSKDSVIKEVPESWLEKHQLWGLPSLAEDKQTHLTRPDLGRGLSEQSIRQLKERYPQPAQVQIVISDGLSTDAVLSNYEEILPPLLKGLKTMQYSVAEPFFLKHGRVKAQDVIGEALGCDVVLMLIGERPGLGQSESLSCYAVYRPTRQTLESERTVISNIHRGGMPPVEAAAVIVDLAARMIQHKASGISLNKALGSVSQ